MPLVWPTPLLILYRFDGSICVCVSSTDYFILSVFRMHTFFCYTLRAHLLTSSSCPPVKHIWNEIRFDGMWSARLTRNYVFVRTGRSWSRSAEFNKIRHSSRSVSLSWTDKSERDCARWRAQVAEETGRSARPCTWLDRRCRRRYSIPPVRNACTGHGTYRRVQWRTTVSPHPCLVFRTHLLVGLHSSSVVFRARAFVQPRVDVIVLLCERAIRVILPGNRHRKVNKPSHLFAKITSCGR